jgi:ankyrin repeat protein
MSTELFAAVKKRGRKGIEAALKAGADIDAGDPDDDENTALGSMCKSKSGAMSKTEQAIALWLIELGADVMKANDRGETPMHLLARSATDLVVLEAIVAKGATVTRTKIDYTPLHYCFMTNDKHVAMWDRLIELGCGLEDRNKWGSTALLTAVTHHNAKAVTYLLAKGADREARDSDGLTALEVAAKYTNDKLHKLLAR